MRWQKCSVVLAAKYTQNTHAQIANIKTFTER